MDVRMPDRIVLHRNDQSPLGRRSVDAATRGPELGELGRLGRLGRIRMLRTLGTRWRDLTAAIWVRPPPSHPASKNRLALGAFRTSCTSRRSARYRRSPSIRDQASAVARRDPHESHARRDLTSERPRSARKNRPGARCDARACHRRSASRCWCEQRRPALAMELVRARSAVFGAMLVRRRAARCSCDIPNRFGLGGRAHSRPSQAERART